MWSPGLISSLSTLLVSRPISLYLSPSALLAQATESETTLQKNVDRVPHRYNNLKQNKQTYNGEAEKGRFALPRNQVNHFYQICIIHFLDFHFISWWRWWVGVYVMMTFLRFAFSTPSWLGSLKGKCAIANNVVPQQLFNTIINFVPLLTATFMVKKSWMLWILCLVPTLYMFQLSDLPLGFRFSLFCSSPFFSFYAERDIVHLDHKL